MTPQSGYADYTPLQTLGKTALTMAVAGVGGEGGRGGGAARAAVRGHAAGVAKRDSSFYSVTLTNTGKTVAFQVHLRVLKGRAGDDILPVIFSDNYLELAPGESRVLSVAYADSDAEGKAPFFLATAWNIAVTDSKGTPNAAFELQK
jgi:exo-1,4-beta-D-glucosaminidase